MSALSATGVLLRRGDTVTIRWPSPPNAILRGRQAMIREVTSWGYLLTGTGVGTDQYRALASELEPAGGSLVASREQGYSGDCCPGCGGVKMVRNGSCLLCMDCGQTTGCS